MIKRLFRNHQEKEETGSWLLSQDNFLKFFFYLLILFLPTQLGKHFWPQFSFVQGLRLDYLSPTLYLTDILILFIIIFSFKKIVLFLKQQNKKIIILIILFFLSLFLGAKTSGNLEAAVYGILKITEFLFLAASIFLNFKIINKKTIALILISGIIFQSYLSFLQILNGGSLNGLFYFLGERYFTAQTPGIANAAINGQLILRPYGTFSHPNVLAGYLIFAMIYIISFKKEISKQILFAIVFIGSTSLVLTLSRSAILFWCLYLFILFATSLREKYKKRNPNKKNTIKAIVAILVLIMLFIISLQTIFLQRFLQTSLSEESVFERTNLSSQALKMFRENPVFGVGLNNFYTNLDYLDKNKILIQPVHNIFLLTLAETGVVGLAYFLLIFGKALKKKTAIVIAVIFLGMLDHYFLTIQQGQIMIVLVLSQAISVKIKT